MTSLIAALAVVSTAQPQAVDPKRMQVIWDAFDSRVNTQTDVWFDDGEFPRVIQGLRIMFSLHPTDYEVATNLGWMLENIEEDAKAVAIYEQFRKLNPNDPDAPYPLANYWSMERKYEKVPPLLEPTIKMARKPHPNTYRRLAHAYERSGKLADSRRVWLIYLKIDPNDQAAKNNLKRVEDKLKAKPK